MLIIFLIYLIPEDITEKEPKQLLEFPITHTTECSRVATRSYVFTLDAESLLITFSNEPGN